ncbi:MAG: hypothetical protein HYY24_13060 [Verrucomicrobia bacterium]|nr:hypothetical protein [Verrucomicrobiota bacterium]
MNEIVIERLARRLLKCPFDGELFDSALGLRLHLCDAHRTQISRPHRVACQASPENTERPRQLYCCPHCDFVVPEPSDQNPHSGIVNHLRAEHPNPFGPVQVSFAVSSDEELIDGYMEQQGSIERRACERCRTIYVDDDSIALHWTEEHLETVTVEEVRRTIETDPERFRILLAEIFRELEEDEARNRLAYREPDDGYPIHHSPSVPRVQSRPAESIVYIERESLHFLDRELDELLEREGWDDEVEVSPGEEWADGRLQTTVIELRFCNIVDGYIPLVKDVRRILPPLMDGEAIEVSWEAEQDSWFPCKVSRSKRAIYNIEWRLRDIFRPFPSGVRLHITRAGPRSYRLGVKRQPHIVPNCKAFSSDGRGGWTVEIRDETVEWETGDQVFRHQLNFQQMEALRDEARRAGRSVRDGVQEVMKRLAQSRPLHVRTVHDAVFLWIRTCSLAAVWAQFRPEHSCYARVQPGWYRFDPAGRFPEIRVVSRRERSQQYPRDAKRYRVKQQTWRHNIYASRLEDFQNDPSAYLEVCCAFGKPNEKVFRIPMPYLLEKVIPHADCNMRGQYLFTVNPHDFVFTWDHGFRMEGKRFLADTE